jgi:TolB-like protein
MGAAISVFTELKRRSVFKVGAVYLAIAWLLLQVVDTVAPILELPDWFARGVLLFLVVGFPVALVLAWAFELTPSGIQRDDGVARPPAGRRHPIDYVIVVTLGLALAYFVADKYLFTSNEQSSLDASIAVLPFQNLSQDQANEPFVDGIHDDLLTQLSRIASLRVTSRTSVLQYRNTTKTMPTIGAELGVATVLEAGVQRLGDSVRINAQLIDAAADRHIWAETYDRQLTAANVFDIQGDIATAIAESLQVALTSDDRNRLERVPTHSIAALDSYFVGKRLLEDRALESLHAAIEYFETVVEIDPDFALGWSGLADAYMLLPEYSYDVDRELVETKARAAVTQALRIDPDIPEVKASQAWYELRFFDWDSAEKIFRDAVLQAPDNTNVLHWLSHVLSWRGKHEEALQYARKAVEVEPESKMMRTNLAYILVDAGLFDDGIAMGRSMQATDPDYVVQRRNLYLHELRAGRARDAAETFASYTEATGGNAAAATEIGRMFVAWQESGEVGAVTDELIERAQLGSEDLAQVLAFVGDADGAIEALQVAAAQHSGSRSVFSMKINPGYDFIRDDPRFQALLEEVGLAD